MNVMSWDRVLWHRRQALSGLYQARKHAVLAGDRPVVDALDGTIRRQLDRVRFAERKAIGLPPFRASTTVRFATSPEQAPSCDGAKAGRP